MSKVKVIDKLATVVYNTLAGKKLLYPSVISCEVIMLFSGTVFLLLFLPLLLLCYFLCPAKHLRARNGILIVFSLIFYSFGGLRYTALLLCSVLLNYTGAMGVSLAKRDTARRCLMIAGVAANLALLGYFKYAGFAVSIVNDLGAHIPVPEIVLPLGISFYTFQGMSYLLDVYLGKTAVQKNPFLVLLYIILFPQLVAGPIVNYTDVEHELVSRTHSVAGFSEGMTRFMLGLGKKMLLAGPMAEIADAVFAIPRGELPVSAAWIGALAYLFQIYFDFSGYSDMAIGLGRIFGFYFPENFNYPYIAASVTEFWRRWHITLSRFFRDYVYIPLGGNRCGTAKQVRNLLVVWFLTGLWHGANWTFVVWGLYYAAFLILEKFVLKNALPRIPKPLCHAGTLLVVLVGWVFFRAPSLSDAGAYLAAMFGLRAGASQGQAVYYLREYAAEWIFCVAASLPLLPWLRTWCGNRAKAVQSLAYAAEKLGASAVFLYSYVKLATGSFNPFIYFHF